jgi:predicted DNA-binding ribbon-helix-helix protein
MEHATLKLKDNLKDITDEKLNATNVCRLCFLRWVKTTTKTKHRQTSTQTGNGKNPRS